MISCHKVTQGSWCWGLRRTFWRAGLRHEMSLLSFLGLLSTLLSLLDLAHICDFLFCLCLSGFGQGHLHGSGIGTWWVHQWVQLKRMALYSVYESIEFLIFLVVYVCMHTRVHVSVTALG